MTLAARPLVGIGPLAATAIAGMALYSVWTLASAWWSHSPSRALIEFDRAMMYTLALTLTASKKGASTLLANVEAATPDYVPANNNLSLSTLIK